MSQMVKVLFDKLPTMLGAGILGVSLIGLGAAAIGVAFPLAAELLAAGAGMAIGSRYA